MGLPALVYNGVKIGERDGKLCLTHLWRAAGADASKQPSDWLSLAQAKEFIEFLNAGNSGILIEAERGRGGGTWAHWQLGLAYAKYLSPEFHAWCNTVVRARMEGRGLPVQAVQGAITVSKEDFQHFAVTLGESAGRGAIQAAREVLREDARIIIREETGPRFDAIEDRFAKMEEQVGNNRQPASPATISKHIRANYKLGGNCPCCGVNRVSNSDGSRAPHTHLDHFLQVGKKNLQSTWIVCRECNLKKLPKDRSGCRSAFDAYQKRLIDIFGREEYFGADRFQEQWVF